jgi:hypothetical protein
LFCLDEPCQNDFWAGKIGQIKNLFLNLIQVMAGLLCIRLKKFIFQRYGTSRLASAKVDFRAE